MVHLSTDLFRCHYYTSVTQASLYKNKNTKVPVQATVAEKNSLFTEKKLKQDQARMEGPSRWVKEGGSRQMRGKETKSFLFIKLSKDIVSYSNYFYAIY